MKKSKILLGSALTLIGVGLLVSCGNKQKNETEQQEAVEESFTPGEKTTAVDTLQQIEEMVEAVETPVAGINGTKYNAAFFNNSANQGSKASADTALNHCADAC